MRWKNARKSSNVEDRRGRQGFRRPAKFGGGALLIVLLLTVVFGGNPLELLGLLGGQFDASSDQSTVAPPDDESAEFVSIVLADMEDIWLQLFAREGGHYTPATLVLFSDAVSSACGYNTAATGPFYCPGDQRIYIDLSFMRELHRMGANGDFALAYVIAHEVGHHVQRLRGTHAMAKGLENRSGLRRNNEAAVAVELQADCFAGIWAHHSYQRGTISYDADDFAEGLQTAAVIGDDHLQRQAGQRVQPETFTHGSSAQRTAWLRKGLEEGAIESCNTFE